MSVRHQNKYSYHIVNPFSLENILFIIFLTMNFIQKLSNILQDLCTPTSWGFLVRNRNNPGSIQNDKDKITTSKTNHTSLTRWVDCNYIEIRYESYQTRSSKYLIIQTISYTIVKHIKLHLISTLNWSTWQCYAMIYFVNSKTVFFPK